MFVAKNINIQFGDQKILTDATFSIQAGERIGLVGRNGSGKTTLLKMFANRQGADSGKIELDKGKTVAYLPQELVIASDRTVFEEAFDAFEDLAELEAERNRFEECVEAGVCDLEKYAEVCEKLLHANPDAARAETVKILKGLGFDEEAQQKPVAELSIGWRMRVLLANLLLRKADFYLFDEPTNHLDIVAKEWFLEFMQESRCGFMLVSHDRFFLDHLCEKVCELSLGRMNWYRGNYSAFEVLREERVTQVRAAAENQQKMIAKKRATIDRFRAKATKAKMAQSMMKELAKVELIEAEPEDAKLEFRFPMGERSGEYPLRLDDVSFAYGDKKIFNDVNFTVRRGSRVAIVAPNGAGKTTLFNVIVDKLKAGVGDIVWGYRVKTAYFEQEQIQVLNPKATVFEEVLSSTPGVTEQDVRRMLGAFLFPGDDVFKKISVLSGGERNRVAMTKVLLQKANVLLLDEPTNHLDMHAKDVLLRALQKYEGTIVFVSHDQDFVNRLSTHIVDLQLHGTHVYEGNYESFLSQLSLAAGTAQGSSSTQGAGHVESADDRKRKKARNAVVREMRKKVGALERRVKKLELEISKKSEELYDSKLNVEKRKALDDEIAALQTELAETQKQWEELVSKL